MPFERTRSYLLIHLRVLFCLDPNLLLALHSAIPSTFGVVHPNERIGYGIFCLFCCSTFAFCIRIGDCLNSVPTQKDFDSVYFFFVGEVFNRNAKQERKYISEIAFGLFLANRLHIRFEIEPNTEHALEKKDNRLTLSLGRKRTNLFTDRPTFGRNISRFDSSNHLGMNTE